MAEGDLRAISSMDAQLRGLRRSHRNRSQQKRLREKRGRKKPRPNERRCQRSLPLEGRQARSEDLLRCSHCLKIEQAGISLCHQADAMLVQGLSTGLPSFSVGKQGQ
ncbi:hypothetical protein CCR84_09690 [Rhodocyclus purpureus]|nr:hypothetical protein [Rhodocyclus purpureus]